MSIIKNCVTPVVITLSFFLASACTPEAINAGRLAKVLKFPEITPSLTAQVADTQVLLTWTSVSQAGTYEVLRSISPSGPFTSVSPAMQGTSFTDASVTNGTVYYYQVHSKSNAGAPLASTLR